MRFKMRVIEEIKEKNTKLSERAESAEDIVIKWRSRCGDIVKIMLNVK